MAQWMELLRLNLLQGELGQFYDRKFPRHIRHCLCLFIESQDWDSAAADENKARICFQSLQSYLEEQCNRSLVEGRILKDPDFPGIKDYLVNHFEESPLQLAKVLSECLHEEKKVLSSASQEQHHSSPLVKDKWRVLDNRMNLLLRQTLEIKTKMSSMTNNHAVGTKRRREALATVADLAQGEFNFNLQTISQVLLKDVVNILQQLKGIVKILTEEELPEWRHRQQLACIGSPVSTCVFHLQKWFTDVAELILCLRRLLHKLQEQNRKYKHPDLSVHLEQTQKFAVTLLTNLLTNALIVEKQPAMGNTPQRPLVIKTGVRFSVTVRFLVNLPEFRCLLKIKPFFDKDIEEIIQTHGLRQFELNKEESKVMDVETSGDSLVTEFVQMTLKEIKTWGSRSCEQSILVTEEFHIIKFATCLQFDGLTFNIEVSSLPLVVVSATAQIPAAWASVMWRNMLSTSEQQNLLLFLKPPPTVTWQQLSQVLSWQFLSVGKRGLDDEQLSMLRDKIVDESDGLVHWSNFKSDNVWIWIDAILDLIKKHLLDLWHNGYIMGFVSRKTTQVLLEERVSGTFLLRFSESIKDGAITFSWVEHSAGETHVHNLAPCTKKDLSAMSLPDTLRLFSMTVQGILTNPLLYLYPQTPRDVAFGPYYSSEKLTKKDLNGYVERQLVPIPVYPTPPSSPPQDMDMDLDLNTDLGLLEELIQDLLDSPGSFGELP